MDKYLSTFHTEEMPDFIHPLHMLSERTRIIKLFSQRDKNYAFKQNPLKEREFILRRVILIAINCVYKLPNFCKCISFISLNAVL